MEEDNKKHEKGTLGWLRERQKIKAKKDGFDNIDDWLRWKSDPFNILEKKHGEEFVDWARKNKDRIPDAWLNAGCKTSTEYNNKNARDIGFKDWAERLREWRHDAGISGVAIEANEDCSSWFGEFTEKLMIHRYPGAIKMPPQNPGFDYLWRDEDGKEVKIDNKGRCLQYIDGNGSPRFIFLIIHNNVADRFILSGWNNRKSLTPLVAFEFKKNDLVRYGKGARAPKVEFWKRQGIVITYNPEGLKQFEDHQIDIGWLIDLNKELQYARS